MLLIRSNVLYNINEGRIVQCDVILRWIIFMSCEAIQDITYAIAELQVEGVSELASSEHVKEYQSRCWSSGPKSICVNLMDVMQAVRKSTLEHANTIEVTKWIIFVRGLGYLEETLRT